MLASGTALSVLILILVSWPESSSTNTAFSGRLPARVERVGMCPPDSVEATLGQDAGLQCHQVLVELLEGPDTGQLFPLTPLFSQATTPGTNPYFASGQIIEVRQSTSAGSISAYHFAERNRSVTLFVLIAAAAASTILAGQWIGARMVLVGIGTIGLLGLYSVPALNQPASALTNQGITSHGVTAAATGVFVLVLIWLLDEPLQFATQLTLLTSSLTAVISVILGRIGLALAHIGGPVPAELLTLSPLSSGSNLAGFVLLGVVIGSVLLISSISRIHIHAVLGYLDLHPESSLASVFFASLGVGRRQTANGIGLFALASLSASLPLIGLFGAEGFSGSQALNNELVASAGLRIAAGVMALVLAGPIASGLATVLLAASKTPNENNDSSDMTVGGRGEIKQQRPPRRREIKQYGTSVIDLTEQPMPAEVSVSRRLRIGIDDL